MYFVFFNFSEVAEILIFSFSILKVISTREPGNKLLLKVRGRLVSAVLIIPRRGKGSGIFGFSDFSPDLRILGSGGFLSVRYRIGAYVWEVDCMLWIVLAAKRRTIVILIFILLNNSE